MKLTYWIAECLTDSKAYSIRAESKKEVAAKLAELGATKTTYHDEPAWAVGQPGNRGYFGEVHKVEVEYTSGFDLLNQCLNEGGIHEGR